MQRALRNTLMTENGTEKLDNELIGHNTVRKISRRLRNYTSSRVLKEKKNNKGQATYPEETSHNSIGHGIQVSTSNTPLTAFQTCLLATLPLLTNAVYSSYDAGTIKPSRDVTCMAGIQN